MPFNNDCIDTIGKCANDIPALEVGQNFVGEQCLTLRDRSGQPLDLTQYGISNTSSSSSSSSSSGTVPFTGVQVVAKDWPTNPNALFCKAAVIKDALNGEICIPLVAVDTALGGTYTAMAVVIQNDDRKFQYPFWFTVNVNLLDWQPASAGPLTIAEIRLSIRDTCPDINFLLDAVEFQDNEIAWAIRQPIEYWNEVPPPVASFSPYNFPYRYHWRLAATSELLRMAAIWMRRNDLDYSAAGLSVADTKKWPDYWKLAAEMRADWQKFVKDQKIAINIDSAFVSMGGYRYTIPRG